MVKKISNVDSQLNVHIGSRVRVLRLMQYISQEKLGIGCGVSFQQIQKYEKGMNAMSAARLYSIAKFLNVNVQDFFEGFQEK